MRNDEQGLVAEVQRVAVRLCFEQTLESDQATGPRNVFNNDRLLERGAQTQGHLPRQGVERSTRRDSHNDGDLFAWKGLRPCQRKYQARH